MLRETRGVSLGATLLVTALVVTLGFGLSGLSVSQLNRAANLDNRQRAENLADSAISLTTARLMSDDSFGPTSPNPTVTVHHAGSPTGAEGLLTFDPATATGKKLPLSVNNLNNIKSITTADGRVVPASSALLVARGSCNGLNRTVEVVLHCPPFPYAIATSGSIQSSGTLTVAGVASLADADTAIPGAPVGPQPPPKPLPADVAANASGGQAVVISGKTSIAGDLDSAGDIKLDPNQSISIMGQTRRFAQPIKIPDVPLASYDPATGTKPYTTLNSPPGSNPTLGGINRYKGDLYIQGDLNLDSGLLYVEGNLHVSGGIQGKGGLVTSGNLTVDQASHFDSGNRLAVLSGGNVTLSGSGGTGSVLQGIVYTKGDFSANKVTLVGSLIANGDPAKQQVKLQDSGLISTPEYQQIDVNKATANEQVTVTVRQVQPPGPTLDVTIRHTHNPEKWQVSGNGKNFTMTPPVDENDVNAGNTLLQGLGLQNSEQVSFDYHDGSGAMVAESNFAPLLTRAASMMTPVSGSPTGANNIITFDPSQFLKPQDRMRISLWKDI